MEPSKLTSPTQQQPTDDKHAQALAQMATLDYKLEQSKQPPQKHFISKKVLIYLAISAVLGIVSLLLASLFFKPAANTPSPINTQTQQLLDTVKEVRELQNQ